MMYWDGGSTVSWIAMTVGMVAFWAAVVVLVIWPVRSLGSSGDSVTAAYRAPLQQADATELLKRRYAYGEIERAEYDQKLRDLS